jgi:two-component system cell cycle sensor histidine kinase/response regulator CckA
MRGMSRQKEALRSIVHEVDTLPEKKAPRGEAVITPGDSDQLHTILANSSYAGVYMVQDGKFAFANHHAAHYAGYGPQEMVGVPSLKIVHPEDREAARENAVRMLKGFRSAPYEFRIITKEGRVRWIMETVTPITYRGKRAVLGNSMDITEQKDEREKVQNLEALKASFLDAIPHAAVGLQNRVIIFANKAVDDVFGWHPEELVGKTTRVLYRSDEEYEEIGRYVYSVLNDQRTCSLEIPCVRMDGREITVKLTASRIGESLQEGKIIAIYEDITKRKRAAKALRESDQFNKAIISGANVGIVVYDRALRHQTWNHFMEHLTGCRAEDVLGKSSRDLFPQIHEEYLDTILEKALAGEAVSLPDMTYFVSQSGNSGWVSGNYGPYRNTKGEIVGVIGMVYDITERKNAEEALKKSEERFRAIFETAQDCVFIKDRALNYVLLNPALEYVLGRPASEIIGMSDREVFGDEAEQRIREVDCRVLDGETSEDEYILNINGIPTTLHVVKVPMHDASGEIIGICGIARDITQTRQLEAQLRQAAKMEAIGTLAGGIAHDFNNLLMGIQGHSFLMLMDIPSDHPHTSHLKGIEEIVRSGASLTRQLLGFAKGGKYEVKPTVLNDLIRKSSEMFGRTKKEIQIHHKYEEDVWIVEADQGQIEQVLLNFYVNAWQAMPAGGKLFLETENLVLDENFVRPYKVKPGRYVKVSVTDTGIGMSEETLQRIFEPFFTTKEMGRGMGLGLASAYGIIKNHGGFITVSSQKGRGSTFTMLIPCSETHLSNEAAPEDLFLKGSETILIVDDEEIVLDVGVEILKTLGYQVLSANSGQEALEIYGNRSREIAMIILDMIMPEMGGGKVFDEIRTLNPDVKVLLASGYSMNGQAAAILERGCNGFIQKPYTIKALSEKLREILEEKRVH